MAKKGTRNIIATTLQICQNIKKARESNGITQEDLSFLLKINRSKYKNWEVSTEPSLVEIRTIAEALGVPPASLLSGIIEFGAEDIIKSKKIQRMHDVEDIRLSLNKLTSAIGRLSGLKKDEIDSYLPPYLLDNTGVFENQRTAAGKKNKGKSDTD